MRWSRLVLLSSGQRVGWVDTTDSDSWRYSARSGRKALWWLCCVFWSDVVRCVWTCLAESAFILLLWSGVKSLISVSVHEEAAPFNWWDGTLAYKIFLLPSQRSMELDVNICRLLIRFFHLFVLCWLSEPDSWWLQSKQRSSTSSSSGLRHDLSGMSWSLFSIGYAWNASPGTIPGDIRVRWSNLL